MLRATEVRSYILLDEEFQRLSQSVFPLNTTEEKKSGRFPLVESIKGKTNPYTYFSLSLEKKLSDLSSLLYSFFKNASDAQKSLIVISEIQNFQNLIHAKQRELSSGYDRLLFFPIILAFLSIGVILYKRFFQKSELEWIKLVNKKQREFSRNLHDTAAQDLAAVRVYRENGDIQKSIFFAERALKETRYMIDSLESPLDKNIVKLICETVRSFKVNYKIKTELAVASKLLQDFPQNAQMQTRQQS